MKNSNIKYLNNVYMTLINEDVKNIVSFIKKSKASFSIKKNSMSEIFKSFSEKNNINDKLKSIKSFNGLEDVLNEILDDFSEFNQKNSKDEQTKEKEEK